jgi:hypothetical protein
VAHVADAFAVAVAGVGACRVLIGGKRIDRGQGSSRERRYDEEEGRKERVVSTM